MQKISKEFYNLRDFLIYPKLPPCQEPKDPCREHLRRAPVRCFANWRRFFSNLRKFAQFAAKNIFQAEFNFKVITWVI